MAAIQWYPGHMTKAKRAMEADIKIVDIIIEMVDARAPFATRNPDISGMGQGKARVMVLNKADLAGEAGNQLWAKHFQDQGYECVFMDSRQKNNISLLMKSIERASAAKRERDLKRGIKNRPVRAMVAGIPNVGKSTLINSISGRAMAKTGNKPGVTRGNQWIRLNKQVELLDTPGILWPKFETQEVGERLAFIGSINDMIVNIQELAMKLIAWFLQEDPGALESRFAAGGLQTEFEILEEIARKYGCLSKGGELDIPKAGGILLNEFRSGKLGRVTLELPGKGI